MSQPITFPGWRRATSTPTAANGTVNGTVNAMPSPDVSGLCRAAIASGTRATASSATTTPRASAVAFKPRRAIRRRAAAFPSGHRAQDEPDEEKPDGIFSVCAPFLQRATRILMCPGRRCG